MTAYRYFEDFQVGDARESPPFEMIEADIIQFAETYDPQPMHLGGAGLIASGWQTAALTMRQFVTNDFFRPPPGAIGLGVSELSWLKPVHPGDTLRVRIEITALRKSASNPSYGIASYVFLTFNQHAIAVQRIASSMRLPCRDAGTA